MIDGVLVCVRECGVCVECECGVWTECRECGVSVERNVTQ